MTSKSASRIMTEYAGRFRDPNLAAKYHASQQPPMTARDILNPTRWIGWFLSVQETWALSRLINGLKIQGVVLDVPCGTGKLNTIWRTQKRVLGVDSSPSMLKLFLENGGHEALRAEVTHLPFRTGSVPLVVCLRLLHRLPPEARTDVLVELRRVSSDWGVIYYRVFHRARTWMVRIFRKLGLSDSRGVFLAQTEDARKELQRIGWDITSETSILLGVAPGHVFMVKKD